MPDVLVCVEHARACSGQRWRVSDRGENDLDARVAVSSQRVLPEKTLRRNPYVSWLRKLSEGASEFVITKAGGGE